MSTRADRGTVAVVGGPGRTRRRFRAFGVGDARTVTATDVALVVEAAGWLAAMRGAVAVLPFRRVCALLGLVPQDPDTGGDPHAATGAPHAATGDAGLRIGRSVRAAAARMPWESTCLVQSLAGLVMLRVRGLDGTLYLGVAKVGDRSVAAHSWLRRGQDIVTGGPDPSAFSVLAAYGSVPRRGARRPERDLRAATRPCG